MDKNIEIIDYRSMSGHYRFFMKRDIHTSPVRYIDSLLELIKSPLLRGLYNFHRSRINNYIKLPFKRIWYKYLVPFSENDSNRKLYIILYPQLIMRQEDEFVSYLRSKFNCKIILIIGDKIDSYKWGFDIEHMKDIMDLVCTYNPIDAEKYGIYLHPNALAIMDDSIIIPFKDRTTDVFFIGQDKGRIDNVYNVYRKCKSYGLNCEFYVVGKTQAPKIDGIFYCDWKPYKEVFERIRNSKSVLNILQPGASGVTLRDSEAYNLGCYMISNNTTPELKLIYNEGQLIPIDSLNKEIAQIIQNKKEPFHKRRMELNFDNFYNWIVNNAEN